MVESSTDLFDKGISLKNSEKYVEAIFCFDKILETNPKDVGAWINKASAMIRLGYPEDAIQCYDKVLEIERDSISRGEIMIRKGGSLQLLGKYQEAIQCFDKAEKIFSEANGYHMKHEMLESGRQTCRKIIFRGTIPIFLKIIIIFSSIINGFPKLNSQFVKELYWNGHNVPSYDFHYNDFPTNQLPS